MRNEEEFYDRRDFSQRSGTYLLPFVLYRRILNNNQIILLLKPASTDML